MVSSKTIAIALATALTAVTAAQADEPVRLTDEALDTVSAAGRVQAATFRVPRLTVGGQFIRSFTGAQLLVENTTAVIGNDYFRGVFGRAAGAVEARGFGAGPADASGRARLSLTIGQI